MQNDTLQTEYIISNKVLNKFIHFNVTFINYLIYDRITLGCNEDLKLI